MDVVARVGDNCWERPHAARAAVLIDAEACFGALAQAIERAERSILILGWDFHEDTRLVVDGAGRGATVRELLLARLREQHGLRVRILDWSFAVVFVTERALFPSFRSWGAPRRIDFRYDDSHPGGACHHQKVIVVDDSIAFCGGLDVTARRWDTSEHRPDDPRRIDPWGAAYGPFHDVQMAVDGEAAIALGALARRRWYRATGEWLRPIAAKHRGERWPADLTPDFRDVRVAIARTEPAFEGEPEIREAERLYLDAIASAKESIFVENQYLSSHAIAEALAARLAEPDGPEIAIVGPSQSSGFLEDLTMGAMRSRILTQLTDACAGRRRVAAFHPVVGRDDTPVMVHSKVFVVDDRILRIGSSNLCNRSMSLDTECDLQIEAGDDARVAAAITRVRNALLAEHLGVAPERVADTLAHDPSLVRAIETLGTPERRLIPLEPMDPSILATVLEATAPFDAEQPVEPSRLLIGLGVDDTGVRAGRALLGAVLVIAAAVLAWRWGPFASWVGSQVIGAVFQWATAIPTGPLVATVAIGLASLFMVPITVLVMLSGVLFGPWIGCAVALSGALLGAVAGYGIGMRLWRQTVRRLAGRRLHLVSRHLVHRTMRAMALVRLVPFAPFAVVNLIAGSTRIGLGPFTLGTLVGMAPGTLALCLTADRLAAGRPGEAALIAGCALVVTVALTRALQGQEA